MRQYILDSSKAAAGTVPAPSKQLQVLCSAELAAGRYIQFFASQHLVCQKLLLGDVI